MSKSRIRSLSKKQLKTNVDKLLKRYAGVKDNFKTSKVRSDAIAAMGGLLAQPTTTTTVRRHYFFRARAEETFGHPSDALDPCQYSTLPKHLCNDLGRCHIAGHPVFYGTGNFETSVRETKSETGLIAVCLWVSPPISMKYQRFSTASNAQGQVAQQKEVILDNIRAVYANYGQYNLSRILAHCEAWSDLFLEAEEDYAVSASLSHELLYKGFGEPNLTGIEYGSNVHPEYLNYAIHPRIASKFALYKVWLVERSNQENYFFFHSCAELDHKTGILMWRDIAPEDFPENDPNIPGRPSWNSG